MDLINRKITNHPPSIPIYWCLGKHSCMGSTFPIAILNVTCFLWGEIEIALAEALPIENKKIIILIIEIKIFISRKMLLVFQS